MGTCVHPLLRGFPIKTHNQMSEGQSYLLSVGLFVGLTICASPKIVDYQQYGFKCGDPKSPETFQGFTMVLTFEPG